eukprot:332623-Chlamydomonas_euryale.AAC.1
MPAEDTSPGRSTGVRDKTSGLALDAPSGGLPAGARLGGDAGLPPAPPLPPPPVAVPQKLDPHDDGAAAAAAAAACGVRDVDPTVTGTDRRCACWCPVPPVAKGSGGSNTLGRRAGTLVPHLTTTLVCVDPLVSTAFTCGRPPVLLNDPSFAAAFLLVLKPAPCGVLWAVPGKVLDAPRLRGTNPWRPAGTPLGGPGGRASALRPLPKPSNALMRGDARAGPCTALPLLVSLLRRGEEVERGGL